MTDDYVVVVPSYKRAEILKDKTLALLHRYNIPKEKIYIFVANQEEAEVYKKALDWQSFGAMIIGVLGLSQIRNFIHNYFEEGTKIVSFDDDVAAIKQRINDYECKELEDLDGLIKSGFDLCEKNKAGLWGTYPMVNPMFMHNDTTFDLQFIIGSFFGFINTHDPEMLVTCNSKDDYERTIKFYIRDGKVIRFNGIGALHDFNSLKGGIQAIMSPPERKQRNIHEVMAMVAKYPMFCEFNKARKNRTEIRLVDKRKHVRR